MSDCARTSAAAGIQPTDLAQQTVKDGLAMDFNHAPEGVVGHGIVVVERGQHAQFGSHV